MLYSNAKAEQAKENFREGYNCCQAVVLAFSQELGIDKITLAKLGSSFGGGMGKLREVCGGVSGMFMVAGMLLGYSDPCAQSEKAEHYKLIQELAAKFKQEYGSIICRDLIIESATGSHIPAERTEEYYKKRPCGEYVGFCARIIAELLSKTV